MSSRMRSPDQYGGLHCLIIMAAALAFGGLFAVDEYFRAERAGDD